VGYGATGPAVHQGVVWTQQQADDALDHTLSAVLDVVDSLVKSPTDNQLNAMTSLAYNIGTAAFMKSSVRWLHNIKNYPAAADAFLLWDKVTLHGAKVVVEGLLSRRQAERALYLTP
jgi:lysozyme